MRFAIQKRKRTPNVIIVSLIDVLLVVLIFLMVTTTAKKIEPALRLNLPQSKEAKPGTTEEKPFIIQVTSNYPHFFVENRPVTLDRLQQELSAAAKKDPKLKVSVKADKQAPWGEVFRIVEASKAAQVGAVNFIAEKGK
jgi:biopolymer transport protein ExbD